MALEITPLLDAVIKGSHLLDSLSQAANSHGNYESAYRKFDWWLRWASEEERESLSATSPYARAVVAEHLERITA
jgi:hypothetical protein